MFQGSNSSRRFIPYKQVFWTQVNSNWAQESSVEDLMMKSPLEALEVFRIIVRIEC